MFVCLRLLHFPTVLNFSTDQATFSTRALELWRNRELTLVGPTASLNIHGRYLIQSSVIYYVTMLFMAPTGFDPIWGSALFVLVSSASVGVLFAAVKRLTKTKSHSGDLLAMVVTSVYVCLPFFLRHTQFLWNPNYQLALSPLLIYASARFAGQPFPSTNSTRAAANFWLLTWGALSGFLLLFHYQMVPAILIMGAWVWCRRSWRSALVWAGGVLLGALPLLAFELNSRFYLTQTVWYWLTQRVMAAPPAPVSSEAAATSGWSLAVPAHYYTTLALLGLVAGVTHFRQQLGKWLNPGRAIVISLAFLVWGILTVAPVPKHAYGMADSWNYSLELRAHQIIQTAVEERGLTNYTVVTTFYDTVASVQYFLLKRDLVPNWTLDYYHNKYLFAVTPADGSGLVNNPAYELVGFSKAGEVSRWPVSQDYMVVLLERGK